MPRVFSKPEEVVVDGWFFDGTRGSIAGALKLYPALRLTYEGDHRTLRVVLPSSVKYGKVARKTVRSGEWLLVLPGRGFVARAARSVKRL